MLRISGILKEVNTEKDSATYTIKVQVGRYKGYNGIDVFPDEHLAELIMHTNWKINEKIPFKENRKNRKA